MGKDSSKKEMEATIGDISGMTRWMDTASYRFQEKFIILGSLGKINLMGEDS